MGDVIQWKVCPRFPHYEVSEYGLVRRCVEVRGKVGGLISPYFDNGYPRYRLRLDGRHRHVSAHQLVAEAFIGPKPFDGAEVCHNDGSRANAHYSNLRWDTHRANLQDAVAQGTSPRGSRNGKAKLGAEDVYDIRSLYKHGWLQREIAEMFNISAPAVSMIVTGANWGHLR